MADRRRALLALALVVTGARWMFSFLVPPGVQRMAPPAQAKQAISASVSSVLLTPLAASAAAPTWPNDFWDYMTILLGVVTCTATLGFVIYDNYFRENPQLK